MTKPSALDNVHDFTSVFYPSETLAEACRDLLQQNKVAAGCAYNVADPVFSVRSTATKPSTASHLIWVGLSKMSVSYGRKPRPVQAPSGPTAHTTKTTRRNFKRLNIKSFPIV